jgi:hypothetical protein
MIPVKLTLDLSLFESDLRHIAREADRQNCTIPELIEGYIVQQVAMAEAQAEVDASAVLKTPSFTTPFPTEWNGAPDSENGTMTTITADGIDAST